MFMNLHKTAESAPTEDDETLLVWCPRCKNTFSHWLYAGVRYRYMEKLEGAPRFQSELDAASDSE